MLHRTVHTHQESVVVLGSSMDDFEVRSVLDKIYLLLQERLVDTRVGQK